MGASPLVREVDELRRAHGGLSWRWARQDARGERATGSCLRRNDGGGRRNDGGGAAWGEVEHGAGGVVVVVV